jgi:hypothetical protein
MESEPAAEAKLRAATSPRPPSPKTVFSTPPPLPLPPPAPAVPPLPVPSLSRQPDATWSERFTKRFKVRPVWPTTIAALGVGLGWVASSARHDPAVQAVAKIAYGVDVEAQQAEAAAEHPSIDSLADIERAIRSSPDWKLYGKSGDRIFEHKSGVVVAFNNLSGSAEMNLLVSDEAIGSETNPTFILLVLVSMLGGSDDRIEANGARLDAWIKEPTDRLSLFGSSMALTKEGSVFTLRVTESL